MKLAWIVLSKPGLLDGYDYGRSEEEERVLLASAVLFLLQKKGFVLILPDMFQLMLRAEIMEMTFVLLVFLSGISTSITRGLSELNEIFFGSRLTKFFCFRFRCSFFVQLETKFHSFLYNPPASEVSREVAYLT